MRVRIAVTVGQSCREVERGVLEGWLQLKGSEFEKFISDICGWGLDTSRGGKGGMVVVPINKENEAKSSVVRENVSFDRKSQSHLLLLNEWPSLTNSPEFSRVIKRAYEQPA